jgi:hypothetical protein
MQRLGHKEPRAEREARRRLKRKKRSTARPTAREQVSRNDASALPDPIRSDQILCQPGPINVTFWRLPPGVNGWGGSVAEPPLGEERAGPQGATEGRQFVATRCEQHEGRAAERLMEE